LRKYIKLYSRFFDIPDNALTIDKTILGLFNKSVDELKEIVQENDIRDIMIKNKDSRNGMRNNISHK
jgi:hypothetical protein